MGLPPGRTNNKDGRPKGAKSARTIEWEKLGSFITDAGAKRAMRVLNDMDDDTYLDQYGKLLNYFKPKLASTQVQAKADINVSIKEPDWNDGD